tara:strand:+ start:2312 stop:3508 length:1197 start_codon:yes stop_codon:yes gene_type:complete
MSYLFDIIHGYIKIHDGDNKFINNAWMKRLKRIKQLGVLDNIFPSASHSRFEHVLGVYHLADRYIAKLEENTPTRRKLFTKKQKRCIMLAGLFHDLGHGPFSHIFDNIILSGMDNIDPHFKDHENRSRLITEKIFEGMSANEFTGYDIDLIKDIIEPPDTMVYVDGNNIPHYSKKKSYLYEIINNRLTSVDVDKFDYLQRDSKHIGLDYTFDCERIFNKSHVHNNSIVYDTTIQNNIFDLFYTRYRLHKDIYNHKKSKLLELMVGDALKKSNIYNFSEIITSDKFLELDDTIYKQILYSDTIENSYSRRILENIEKNVLYESIYYGKYSEEIVDTYDMDKYDSLLINFNLCNGDNNPLSNIKFIDRTTDICEYGCLNNRLIPEKYSEQMILIYNSYLN